MNGVVLQFDSKNPPPEDRLQRCHIGLLPAVMTLPEVHQSTKRPDEKDARTAGRVQDTLAPRKMLIGHDIIEHQASDHGRREHSPLTPLGKVLIQMAENFDW